MFYRKFGDTDLEVSEICFGPMRFSAKEQGDDEKSRTGNEPWRGLSNEGSISFTPATNTVPDGQWARF